MSDGVYYLNDKQVKKLRKKWPALFDEVVNGIRVPIQVDAVRIVLTGSIDLVGVYSGPPWSPKWLGDVPFATVFNL